MAARVCHESHQSIEEQYRAAAMGSEIELKFQVSSQEMKTLRAARSLRPMDAETTEAEKLLSVYFDTAERRLRRKGISLRVRHNGEGRVQTIKTQTSSIPFSRGQWEHKIEGDQPDLRFIRGTPLAKLRTKKLRYALSPIFATQIHRVTRLLNENGSRIEMALDEGLVRAGRKTEPISEVELELKRGNCRGSVQAGETDRKLGADQIGIQEQIRTGL